MVIVGLTACNTRKSGKFLYIDDIAYDVANISPYLTDGVSDIVKKRTSPLCKELPDMDFGSQSIDGGNLFFDVEDFAKMDDVCASKYARRAVGSNELVKGLDRFCLWIEDDAVDDAYKYEVVKNKIQRVKEFRLHAKSKQSQAAASIPWKFCSIRFNGRTSLVVPRVSSERRQYIPMAYVDNKTVVLDSALFVEDCPAWLFAILESRMHMVWIRTVCGKLETRIRYSNTLGYNTFPVPSLTDDIKSKLNQSARTILFARENHSEKTLAELYDPEKMPDDLRQAHIQNDLLVDSLYKTTRFRNDEERLSQLFELYEQMVK